MTRVIIIHGWASSPRRHWFPWLKKELRAAGYTVHVAHMNTYVHPNLSEWRRRISKSIGKLDDDCIIVTHSLGAAALFRYFEKTRSTKRCKAVIMVAPLVQHRLGHLFRTFVDPPFNEERIKSHIGELIVFHDPLDRFAPFSNANYLRKHFGATLIKMPGRKHFDDFDGVSTVPEILEAIKAL